jgi:hypothetical protein
MKNVIQVLACTSDSQCRIVIISVKAELTDGVDEYNFSSVVVLTRRNSEEQVNFREPSPKWSTHNLPAARSKHFFTPRRSIH